jgi:hypothetical protein
MLSLYPLSFKASGLQLTPVASSTELELASQATRFVLPSEGKGRRKSFNPPVKLESEQKMDSTVACTFFADHAIIADFAIIAFIFVAVFFGRFI